MTAVAAVAVAAMGSWARPAPRRKACSRAGCPALATGGATSGAGADGVSGGDGGGGGGGGGDGIGAGAGARIIGGGASLSRSQSSGITEADTSGGSATGILTGVGGRKSCCSLGTWSATVGGGTAVGLRKSNRSGSVSIDEAPWNCGAITGVGMGAGTEGLATAPISASKLFGDSPAKGWLSTACTLKSMRAWIS